MALYIASTMGFLYDCMGEQKNHICRHFMDRYNLRFPRRASLATVVLSRVVLHHFMLPTVFIGSAITV